MTRTVPIESIKLDPGTPGVSAPAWQFNCPRCDHETGESTTVPKAEVAADALCCYCRRDLGELKKIPIR